MPFESKYGVANNNGYPVTAYGNVDNPEKAVMGRSSGDDAVGQFVLEYFVNYETTIGAGQHNNLMVLRVPAGVKIQKVSVNASVSWTATKKLMVGLATADDGVIVDADCLFTGVPVADTYVEGTLLTPATKVLTEDHYVTLTNDAGTLAGAATVRIVCQRFD